MSEKTITSLWECECSSKNPLRLKQCKICGSNMPNHFLSQIYYEELREQKAFFIVEDLEASRKRCLKMGNVLVKMKSAVVPIMLILLVVLNAGRFYFDNSLIGNLMFNSVTSRKERLWNELESAQGHLTGLKVTPVVIETVFFDIVTSAEDIKIGMVKGQSESNKQIDHQKIEHAKEKIEGVIEYVTDKFR